MLLTTAISLFLAFWSLLFLADFYLRAYTVNWYIDFANRVGLTVSFFQVRFYTNRYHSLLYQPLSVSSPQRFSLVSRCISAWFTLGATVALVCFCGITLYLSKLLWSELAQWIPSVSYSREQLMPQVLHLSQAGSPNVISRAQRFPENEVGLTPVVPGVNVPWEHMPLFLLVLAFAGVIHELGHALAAIDANVPVNGFGIFLFAIYPGAFTEIDTEALGRSTSAQKMRIFGAGIWHNLILAIAGYLILVSAPGLLSPLYVRDNGVVIRDVDSRSGLSGAGGLRDGHIVYAINGCGVRNSADWHKCVREMKDRSFGYCMPDDEIVPSIATKVESYDGELHCCSEFTSASSSHICFHFKNESARRKDSGFLLNVLPKHGFSVAPNLAESLGLKPREKRAIRMSGGNPGVLSDAYVRKGKYQAVPSVPAALEPSRKATVAGNEPQGEGYACLPARPVTDHLMCNSSTDCKTSFGSKSSTCVFPALFNGTSLLRFYVGNSSRPVLFIGSVDELIVFVKLSDFAPLYFFSFPWLPYAVELFAKYLITFSLAIALLNAVPCYGLDGQFISSTVVDSVFGKWSSKQRVMINNVLLYYGVVVLAGNVAIGFVRFLHPYFTSFMK